MHGVRTSGHQAVHTDGTLTLVDARSGRDIKSFVNLAEHGLASVASSSAHGLVAHIPHPHHRPHLRLVQPEQEEKGHFLKNEVQVGDITTRYISAGPQDGQVLLFLHGSGNADSQGWHKNINFFAELGYRVLAPDLPGFGETKSTRKEKCTDKFHVEFVDNFLTTLGVNGKVNIVGASAGGFTTVMYASAHTDKVSDIVTVGLYDPQTLSQYATPWPSILSHPRLTEYSIWIAARSKHIFKFGYKVYERVNRDQHRELAPITAEKIEQTRQDWKSMRRGTFEYISEHRRQTKAYNAALNTLAQSDVRVLFLHGGKDNITFSESSEHAAAFLGSSFVRFANSTHAPQRDNPEEFNLRVMNFFNQRRVEEQEPIEIEARRSLRSRLLWWKN